MAIAIDIINKFIEGVCCGEHCLKPVLVWGKYFFSCVCILMVGLTTISNTLLIAGVKLIGLRLATSWVGLSFFRRGRIFDFFHFFG